MVRNIWAFGILSREWLMTNSAGRVCDVDLSCHLECARTINVTLQYFGFRGVHKTMSEFRIPPISTLAGSSLGSYFKILRSGTIAKRSYLKVALTTIIVLLRAPFQLWEDLAFVSKTARSAAMQPPLFILGHWRSGTTLLHNVLCQDPRAAYLTTYASVFPNNMASTWIFKTFMRMGMPDKRPSDNVALDPNFPQEDGFAFANMQANAYYNFFYFPSRYAAYYDRAVHHIGLDEREVEHWYRTYAKLLRKAVVVSKGARSIVKNPVNTARVDKLLRLYPDAKFLYIHRNPITVYYSTLRFFETVIHELCLEELPTQEFLGEMILDVHHRMMRDLAEQRSRIPAGNLLEIRYDTFVEAPMATLEMIERQLFQRDPATALPYYASYLKSQAAHRTHSYQVDKEDLAYVVKRLEPYMHEHGFALPKNIQVRPEPTEQVRPIDAQP